MVRRPLSTKRLASVSGTDMLRMTRNLKKEKNKIKLYS